VRVSGDELFVASVARSGASRVAKIVQGPMSGPEARTKR